MVIPLFTMLIYSVSSSSVFSSADLTELCYFMNLFFFFSSDLDILLATAWKWAIVG